MSGPAKWEPWDPGLPPERTALAWQRTALAHAAAALGLAKLASHHSTALAVAVLATALPLSLALLAMADRRARRTQDRLRRGAPLRAGRLPLAGTALTLLLGLGGLLHVLVR